MELEKYIETFADEFENQRISDKARIEKEFLSGKNQTEWKAFMNGLFEKCYHLQTQNRKNSIQYMVVHVLRASLRMENYEYMFALYDEQLYFDRKEVCSYRSISGFKNIADSAVKYFTGLIRIERREEKVIQFNKGQDE